MLSVRCLSCPVCDVRALWPNGWTYQDKTWHAGRVRWGPSSPSPKGHSPPIFGPHLLRPNGWMDEGGTWQGGRHQPRRLFVRWGHSHLPPKGGGTLLPNFRPISIVATGKTVGCIKMPLGVDVGLSPGDFVLHGDPVLPPEQRGGGHIVLDGFPALRERRTASPSFRVMSIVATVAHLSYC